MKETLEALVNGVRMGQLVYHKQKDQVVFRYDADWMENPNAYPLSLSMPLIRAEHPDKIVRTFIAGLLPDNTVVLDQWGKRYHVSPRNPFRLLQHVGEECAGAVQFVKPDRASEWLEGKVPDGIDWLTDEELRKRIEELVADHSSSRRIGDRGHFSLAGAQPKMGLFRDEERGRWGVPEGDTPTTHILKPNIGQFRDYDQNEHFCLHLATRIGLTAAKSRIEVFGEIPVIIVTRFDRTPVDGKMIRVHQEDMCQSLGFSPAFKYENDGGPSAKSIFTQIRTYSSRPDLDQIRFLDGLIFNWLIKGTDAHAKNYGFLVAGGPQVRLAPLYDLSSFYPYEDKATERKAGMAMKIGGEYRFWKIGPKQWKKAAREWNFRYKLVVDRIVQQAEMITNVAGGVAEDITKSGVAGGEVLDKLVERIVKNAKATIALFASSEKA